MSEWARYVGLPYEELDCWALVRRVYREQLGVELAADPLAARAQVVEVEKPRAFDVALLRSRHVGVMIDAKRVLHTSRGQNAVVEHLDSRRVIGFYRAR